MWIIESGDARIAVDPAQAADDILRSEADAEAHQTAFAALLAAAGFPRESITHAIATHAEGVGMWAWRTDDGAWVPFFPNATILVDQRELDAIDDGTHPSADDARFARLREQGAVRAVTRAVTDEVTVEVVGAHSPGHLLVWINSGADTAVMVGHLALSPLHFATGECPQQHPDPPAAEGVLERLRGIDALLIGPLWPTPGAGYWVGAGFHSGDSSSRLRFATCRSDSRRSVRAAIGFNMRASVPSPSDSAVIVNLQPDSVASN